MTERVHGDPTEIDRFRDHLQLFTVTLEQSTTRVEAQLEALGYEWQDPEYTRFSAELVASMQHFKQYLQGADLHLAELREKAALLYEFQQRTY